MDWSSVYISMTLARHWNDVSTIFFFQLNFCCLKASPYLLRSCSNTAYSHFHLSRIYRVVLSNCSLIRFCRSLRHSRVWLLGCFNDNCLTKDEILLVTALQAWYSSLQIFIAFNKYVARGFLVRLATADDFKMPGKEGK